LKVFKEPASSSGAVVEQSTYATKVKGYNPGAADPRMEKITKISFEKTVFYKFANSGGSNAIKLFTSVIYECS
jgi:hypothetical protein